MRRYLRPVLFTGIGVFVAMQLVPYGWSHPNPPVTQDAPWPSAEAREMAVRACYDCHSNETNWPVYSYVAPMSWLVRRDVEEGREALNFSTWDQGEQEADEGGEEIEDGAMPPRQYLPLHPDARLSDEEEAVLVAALEAMGEGGADEAEDRREDRLDDAEDRRDAEEDRSGSNSGPG